MLTLNDGRSELWQWDTGRKLTVDADCTQVHFSNKFFGRSVDVDVFDGTAEIPDVLLQVDKDLLVWAFVGTAENGYTKISKVFKVNKRNKPADYVFTPTEQTTLDEIMKRLDRIEEGQDPDAIKNAVDEYLANNPIQVEEKDPTVPEWAKQQEKPSYTATEVGAVATVNGVSPDENGNVEITIPDSGGDVDLTGYATEQYVQGYAQPKGDYLTAIPDGYAKTEDIPTKPEDIGAQPSGNYALKTEIPSIPVQSVNGKTGAVKLSASDVGARPDNWMPSAQEVGALPNTYTPPNQTAAQVGADPKGTAASAVSQHNVDDDSHNDIRLELKAINDKLTAFFDSDNQTLDELSEIVAYITSNKALIDSITTSKVSVADIINNLTTNVANKPLSAAQGVALKGLIDAVGNSLSNYQPKGDYALASAIPTKVSQLQNDKGYLTEHQDISGKLDADKLPEAVNNALSQAKASGEFDGADGKDGQDGYTPQKGIDYFDGQPGKDGEDGADGYTPVKGTDYWTDADKAEMVEEVAAAVGGTTLTYEHSDGDLPKVFLTGNEFSDMTKEKNEVSMELDYVSRTKSFHAYILIKWQGSTSLNFAKKNFTVKLYDDEARKTKQKHLFRDWKYAKHKFVLKANWIDHTHARNIVSANLWNEVVSRRSDYSSLPEELRNSPKNGAIDGFPVKLYVNGTYQGIYTWNIGKDDWQWGMDEDNTNHALLCVTHNTNGVFKDRAYNFRALWSGVDEEAFEIEVGTNSDALKNGVNTMLSCIINNNGSAFKNSIGQYLDVQSAIDYYIHQYIICGLDGLAKNILLGSYNLTKWYIGAYDMDATFGLWYDGTKFVPTDYKCPEDYQEKFNLLFERLEENYWPEIQARYAELRKSVYSFANMCASFERFTDKIGTELFAEDLEVYPGIPKGSTNNIKQLRNYIRDRLAYCDAQILSGVPGTAVSLNSTSVAINRAVANTATLVATKTPSNTTDDVYWWSDNEAIAKVANGVVTAVADGSCTIYAKCGSGYASCAVSVIAAVLPSYTNQVPVSIGTDKKVFNGTGYKDGYRLSSSGSEKESVENTVTGYIPVKGGDTIRIKGYRWYDTTASMNYLNAYKSDFSFLYAACAQGGYGTDSFVETMSYDDTTGVSTVKLKSVADMAYIRICVWDGNCAKGANLIVTVNEEIV